MGLDWSKQKSRDAAKRGGEPAVVEIDSGYGDWLVDRYNAPSKAELREEAASAYEQWSARPHQHRARCKGCGHVGYLHMPPARLAGAKLRCSRCGQREVTVVVVRASRRR